MSQLDVLVLGAGGAGLSAACSAAAEGARTLVLESQAAPGGSTALSGAHIYAADTPVQRAAGIKDSADAMYSYLFAVSQGRMDPAIGRRLCSDSAGAIAWLSELGADFLPDLLHTSGLDTVPRSHVLQGDGDPGSFGQGAALVRLLLNAVHDAGVEIHPNEPATEIDLADDACFRVRTNERTYAAKALVIATGGFGHNPQLVNELMPEVTHGPGSYRALSGVGSTGAGLHMATSLGAATSGLGRGTVHLAPVVLVEDFIYVNERGLRFMNEQMYSAFRSQAVADHAGCFIIFDDAARRRAAPSSGDSDDAVPLLWGVRQPGGATKAAARAEGVLERYRAETLGELEAACGFPIGGLTLSVNAYNRACAHGTPDHFLSSLHGRNSIAEPPFHAVRLRMNTIVQTGFGITIDADAAVVDTVGAQIPGLFAAGEVTGSNYPVYPASGMSLANCITFGRVAGRSAASYARRSRPSGEA